MRRASASSAPTRGPTKPPTKKPLRAPSKSPSKAATRKFLNVAGGPRSADGLVKSDITAGAAPSADSSGGHLAVGRALQSLPFTACPSTRHAISLPADFDAHAAARPSTGQLPQPARAAVSRAIPFASPASPTASSFAAFTAHDAARLPAASLPAFASLPVPAANNLDVAVTSP